jgi:hypothetical protein
MSAIPKRRIRWRATGPDGVAHAFTNLPSAACGAPNQPERFDWGRTNGYCPACMEKEESRQKIAS